MSKRLSQIESCEDLHQSPFLRNWFPNSSSNLIWCLLTLIAMCLLRAVITLGSDPHPFWRLLDIFLFAGLNGTCVFWAWGNSPFLPRTMICGGFFVIVSLESTGIVGRLIGSTLGDHKSALGLFDSMWTVIFSVPAFLLLGTLPLWCLRYTMDWRLADRSSRCIESVNRERWSILSLLTGTTVVAVAIAGMMNAQQFQTLVQRNYSYSPQFFESLQIFGLWRCAGAVMLPVYACVWFMPGDLTIKRRWFYTFLGNGLLIVGLVTPVMCLLAVYLVANASQYRVTGSGLLQIIGILILAIMVAVLFLILYSLPVFAVLGTTMLIIRHVGYVGVWRDDATPIQRWLKSRLKNEPNTVSTENYSRID